MHLHQISLAVAYTGAGLLSLCALTVAAFCIRIRKNDPGRYSRWQSVLVSELVLLVLTFMCFPSFGSNPWVLLSVGTSSAAVAIYSFTGLSNAWRNFKHDVEACTETNSNSDVETGNHI